MNLYHLSGAGNDFLALAEPERPPSRERVRAWCRRGVSLGADGVFVLHREPADAPSGPPRVAMDYLNADGSRAGLCANGTRCAAQLAFHLGWAEDEVVVVTGAGPLRARRLDGASVELEAPPPPGPPEARELEVARQIHRGFYTVLGVPVFVLPWEENLAGAPVAELGPALRSHPELGPEGANVDFVRFASPDRLEVRTWERGVEAETLASGTGVLSAVLVALHLGRGRLPMEALTAGGFLLTVAGEPERGLPRSWSLAGDARLVGRTTLLPGAEASPPPPRWG